MHITFIKHSGFMVELESATLIFDWYSGKLPKIPDGKPLLVFASHSHSDHFDPEIFSLDDGKRDIRFLLGFDTKITKKRLEKWGVSDDTASRCISVSGNETLEPIPGVKVESLFSTDEGVAFLVEADGKTVYHAGDLNWWHWNKDTDDVNKEREERFKRFAEPLLGRHIDAAMVPVDPRQEQAGYWTAEYLLETSDIDVLIPMHQWEDFDFTDGLIKKVPQYKDRIVKITSNGQELEI